MTKIKHPVEDGQSVKLYGVMPAIIDSCSHEEVTAKTGKKYSLLTVDLTLDNETEKGLVKKMFFRLPYDSWDAKPGEPMSLFNQFRIATELSSEELSDTTNYKGKGFNVLVGPEKRYSGEWNTFQGREGGTLLSFNITKVYGEELDAEAEEVANASMIKVAKSEIDEGTKTAVETQPGFSDEQPQNF